MSNNKIPNLLLDFMALLLEADLVRVTTEGSAPFAVAYGVSDATGEADNQVLLLRWDEDIHEYSTVITEEGFANGRFDADENTFFLVDTEGEEIGVQVCKVSPMAPKGA